MNDFEVFERPGTPAEEPTLTITPRGALRLNRAAYALIGRPPEVDLLFRRQVVGRMIGVRAAAPLSGSVQPLRPPYRVEILRDGGSAEVDAKDFLAAYGISFDRDRSWPVEVVDAVLCAELSGETL